MGRRDPFVLIISGTEDEHVPLVTEPLTRAGVRSVLFDPAWFPERARVHVELGSDRRTRRRLEFQGLEGVHQDVDLDDVTAAWHRRPNPTRPHADLQEPSVRAFVELSGQHLLDGLWETLTCRWLPARPSVDRAAHNKIRQLTESLRVGLPVPATVIGNDPQGAAAFLSRTPAAVSKSLIQRPLEVEGADVPVIYTRPVQRRDVRRIGSVARSPVIFQEYVEKSVEIRATVVGDQVFAAEIRSQEFRWTRHDWRHYHDQRVRYLPHRLPPDLTERLLCLVAALGLAFAAIDLVRTPDGGYVFLEINPNGQWGFVEHFAGVPIASAIARFLSEVPA